MQFGCESPKIAPRRPHSAWFHVNPGRSRMALMAVGMAILLFSPPTVFALNPSLDISQSSHTAWPARDGFATGVIFAMAQTPDGYLWLGSEFGLFRFDGVHAVPWQPPEG